MFVKLVTIFLPPDLNTVTLLLGGLDGPDNVHLRRHRPFSRRVAAASVRELRVAEGVQAFGEYSGRARKS